MLMGKHEQHQPPMKIYGKVLLILAVFFAATFTVILSPAPTSAATSTTVCKCTNTYQDGNDTYTKDEDGSDIMLFGDDNGCFCGGTLSIVRMGMNIAMAGIAVLGTIGIILAGVMWLTAGDNAGQIAMAKKRMLQVVVGLAAFGMIDVVGNMLLPGGIASSAPTLVSSSSTRVSGVDLVIDPPASNTTSSVTTAPSVDDAPSTPSGSSPSTSESTSSSTSKTPVGSCSQYGSAGKGNKYWQQYDVNIQWKGGNKDNAKVSASGCPMMGIMHALTSITGCQFTPQMMADVMRSYTNNFTNRRGLFSGDSNWSNNGEKIINFYAKYYGVNVTKISKTNITAALNRGNAVIAFGARGGASEPKIFSPNGHYVTYIGIDGDKIRVVNAARRSASGWQSFSTATTHASRFYEVSL